MQNTIYSLQEIFNNNIFRIPQYQRAYSWSIDPNLESFIDDLRQQVIAQKTNPAKQYFLGTLLLHEVDYNNSKSIHIVDGQQRLTTSVIFISCALNLYAEKKISLEKKQAKLMRRSFIYDEDAESQKFHTIKEDDPFFQSEILKTSSVACNEDSPSSRKLSEAIEFFKANVETNEWQSLLGALSTARVMVYAVDNPADATQIFELQNDRGKQLSDLEALKSFLMHSVYLHSKNPDDRLDTIQTQFAKIFRFIEQLDTIQRAPNEDSVLAYHCAANYSWTDNEWRRPKQLVKRIIQELPADEVIIWVETFTGNLVSSYETVNTLFANRDNYKAFSELLILGRIAPFWPMILKAWDNDAASDKSHFKKACRLMEIYAFKGYAISNLRSDSGQSSLYNLARDFTGDFESLFDYLADMFFWYNLDNRFAAGLENANIYRDDKRDVLYLLWKYENSLRQEKGCKQPHLSWKDFVEPINYATQFSVEHIAAQNDPITQTKVEWIEGEILPFHEIVLHRLGNLVIDSISPNSAKGDKAFADKLVHLSQKSIYLSQGELINFVQTYDNDKNPIWCDKAVKKRHEVLTDFAINEWNPEEYHSGVKVSDDTAPPLPSGEEEINELEGV